jgi:hypothetical protein
MIEAKVIRDSISEDEHRLTTLEVVMNRFVLAEFNTHRMFSRNSASSRAIPLARQIERIQEEVARPSVWATEQKGMSGGDPLDDDGEAQARMVWDEAAALAVSKAKILGDMGVHKSICNRLLEPFMWHTVIVTATEWDGFWWQRLHRTAMPEMRLVAEAMYDAYMMSTPVEVKEAEWHLPYVDDDEIELMRQNEFKPWQISAARCARVSYLTHDGVRSFEADYELYLKLAHRPDMVLFDPMSDPPHASPLEHVATPDLGQWAPGNFHGWAQLRHIELGF